MKVLNNFNNIRSDFRKFFSSLIPFFLSVKLLFYEWFLLENKKLSLFFFIVQCFQNNFLDSLYLEGVIFNIKFAYLKIFDVAQDFYLLEQ